MNVFESEEQEKKTEEKWTGDPWDIIEVSGEDERKGPREYLKDQMAKTCQIQWKMCEYKHPRNSINFQKDKFKETHTKTL